MTFPVRSTWQWDNTELYINLLFLHLSYIAQQKEITTHRNVYYNKDNHKLVLTL